MEELKQVWAAVAGYFSPVVSRESVGKVNDRLGPYWNAILISLLVIGVTRVISWRPRKIRIGR